jgi:CHAD domain-containing protein
MRPLGAAWEQNWTRFWKLGCKLAAQHRLSSNDIHNLRVLIRRLISIIWLARLGSPKTKRPKFRRVQLRLRRLANGLGNRRVMDVNRALAKEFRLNLPESEEGKYQRACRRAKSVIETEFQRRNNVNYWKKVGRKLDQNGAWSEAKMRKRMKRRIRRQRREWNACKNRKPDDYHALRIFLRRLRNAFEILNIPNDELRRHQDLLGRAHDLSEFRLALGRTVTSKEIANLARAESAAWQEAKKPFGPHLRKCTKYFE